MNCGQARELFSAYNEKALDSTLTAAYRQHLSACKDCAAEAAGFEQVWSALGSLNQVEVPQALHDQVMRRWSEGQHAKAAEMQRISFWDALFGRTMPLQRLGRVAAVVTLVALLSATPFVPGVRSIVESNVGKVFFRPAAVSQQDSIALRVSPSPVEGSSSTLTLEICPDRDVEDAWVSAKLVADNATDERAQDYNVQATLRSGKYTSLSVPLSFQTSGLRTLYVRISGNDYHSEKMAYIPVRAMSETRQKAGAIPITLHARNMDIYSVMAYLSNKTKTPIIMDTNLRGKVDVNLEGEKLSSALEKVLQPMGYAWNTYGGVYIVRDEQIAKP